MMLRRALALGALAAPLSLAAQQAAPRADLIVTNARIYTVDDSRPRGSAMAVREGRVQFVGSEREALALKGAATRMLDAGGNTIIPGMIDSHAHLLNLGQSLRNVSLVGTNSYDEVVQRVSAKARTLATGQWLLGRGWDQ